MRSGDLTNAEWEQLESLLPSAADHRTIINAALYQARIGSRWRHLPERFGCWVTAYRHHRLWEADGTWRWLLSAVQAAQDGPGPAGPGDPALAGLRAHLTQIVSPANGPEA
ncbi:transposase [Nonomuraea sp. NPDC046802]|uniref:transposase n=1 Tax=Nonomuraea sp. NPDC046802 TaxID=3154919 RepID=UPI0033E39976